MTVSLLSRTRVSPEAAASPALQAAANPRFSSLRITRSRGLRRASPCQPVRGCVGRGVVDDDDLETRPFRARLEALEAEPVKVAILVGHDNDGEPRKRSGDLARIGRLG